METELLPQTEPKPRRKPRWRLRFLIAVQTLALAMFVISRLEPDRAQSLGPVVEYLYFVFNPPDDPIPSELSSASEQLAAEVAALDGEMRLTEFSRGFLGLVGKVERFDLEFMNSKFGDNDLARLVQQHGDHIMALALVDTNVTDSGLRYLKGLTYLKALSLRKSGHPISSSPPSLITDAGMVYLDLPTLVSLNLSGLPITDAGLESLPDLPALETLELRGTKVEGPGLGAIKALPSIRMLALDDSLVTDEGLGHLSGASHLESLMLDRSAVSWAGINKLIVLPHLSYLGVRGCGLLRGGLNALRGSKPNLRIDW